MNSKANRVRLIFLFLLILFVALILFFLLSIHPAPYPANPSLMDSGTANPDSSQPSSYSPFPNPSALTPNPSSAPVAGEGNLTPASAPRRPRAAADTAPPYIYADPSGGLFYDTVKINLISDEPCSIYYHAGDMPGWMIYREEIKLARSGGLSFYAIDTAGNKSDEKMEIYDIKTGAAQKCPSDMAWVKVGDVGFCVDIYEWPNKKGVVPQAMTSLYAAMDSCMSIGKRLCASHEWHLACAGSSTTVYPYGDRYEPRACNTETQGPFASGRLPECRSYFGAMDMSGNLREWTQTKAQENERFYKVHGGFWDSRVRSSCREYQYSFYPQNTHLSIGFRCCADAK